MGLIKLPAQPAPRVAGWLDGYNSTALQRRVVERSACDDGILEVPLGSNRGTRIDAMVKRSGAPLGSYWCAIWVGAVMLDCGLLVPQGYAAVDAWLPYMVKSPCHGAVVIYGPNPRDGVHCGIVTRLAPLMLTREGNRGYAGSGTRNGVCVDQAPMARHDVLGYVPPERLLPRQANALLRGLTSKRDSAVIADE